MPTNNPRAKLQTMGAHYVVQKPYNMAETYEETSPATPMFFVLFPGVDPTPWVESLARTLDITTENGGACAENALSHIYLFVTQQNQEQSQSRCIPVFISEFLWRNCKPTFIILTADS